VSSGSGGLRSVTRWQVLSALLLLTMGGIHLYLAVKGAGTLGKPFWVNAVGGLVLAVAIMVLRGQLLLLASVLSTLFMAGTLLALVLALTVGLFDIHEVLSYRPVPPTLVVAIGTIVLAVTTALLYQTMRGNLTGLFVLSPVVLREVGRIVARPQSITVALAGRSLRVRANRLATAFGPTILLVGIDIGIGTLLMQHTESTAAPTARAGADLAPVNYTVVGIITAFCCIATVNAFVAAVLGLAAAASTGVPFTIVRTGSRCRPAPGGSRP
jgi:hypothetical protein